jgi:hypothetical protein
VNDMVDNLKEGKTSEPAVYVDWYILFPSSSLWVPTVDLYGLLPYQDRMAFRRWDCSPRPLIKTSCLYRHSHARYTMKKAIAI